MGIVIQKFGGTSLATADGRRRAVHWVARARAAGHRPVVVVSAMGRRGDPYATDTLLDLLAPLPRPPAWEADRLMACGEIIATVVMAAHLRAEGLDAEPMTGPEAGIRTDDRHGDARILSVDPAPVRAVLDAGRVPVVAGFQGRTPAGRLATLGRGGSDTTAVALGAALGAELVDIFTDVDGIKTADPRLVPEARTIPELAYEEVFQLANAGARVLHPRAVEIARQAGTRLRVRSTFSEAPGTLVGPGQGFADPWGHRQPDRAVTGITHLPGLTQFAVAPPAGAEADQHWARLLFRDLGAAGISIDLINLFPDRVLFTVPSPAAARTRQTAAALGGAVEEHPGRAKVTVVGSAIQGLPGVMAQVMEALAGAGVPVLQTADSLSTITVLIDGEHAGRAVQALHRQFGLERDPAAVRAAPVGAGRPPGHAAASLDG
ncbi:aspartokinase I (alpha and beta subunits) [Candidatus Hydrogenisulfobacillus filiaventi]|uniref:Aspartokinase n=1 Tax=Candidatus Hydrogenisulfobacillus filiaventi TaxID=2707344 RepID=A0A6F8ZH33_9FIRM|nr:aspartate kinase [Bacillota bacterium]CAB1129023.1 aspartokinase I (alpha and beta subunits) [Candidatus Hydrogenisulfobacillus filiaventi]